MTIARLPLAAGRLFPAFFESAQPAIHLIYTLNSELFNVYAPIAFPVYS